MNSTKLSLTILGTVMILVVSTQAQAQSGFSINITPRGGVGFSVYGGPPPVVTHVHPAPVYRPYYAPYIVQPYYPRWGHYNKHRHHYNHPRRHFMNSRARNHLHGDHGRRHFRWNKHHDYHNHGNMRGHGGHHNGTGRGGRGFLRNR